VQKGSLGRMWWMISAVAVMPAHAMCCKTLSTQQGGSIGLVWSGG